MVFQPAEYLNRHARRLLFLASCVSSLLYGCRSVPISKASGWPPSRTRRRACVARVAYPRHWNQGWPTDVPLLRGAFLDARPGRAIVSDSGKAEPRQPGVAYRRDWTAVSQLRPRRGERRRVQDSRRSCSSCHCDRDASACRCCGPDGAARKRRRSPCVPVHSPAGAAHLGRLSRRAQSCGPRAALRNGYKHVAPIRDGCTSSIREFSQTGALSSFSRSTVTR